MLRFCVLCFLSMVLLGCEEGSDETPSGIETFDMSNSFNNIMEPPAVEKYTDFGENVFIKTTEQPISTFSVDADGAAYANTRRFLNLGQNPPTASVRIEEYLNYFTFDYEEPVGDQNISLNSELSTSPWNATNHILRLGIKGKTFEEAALPDANFVFLIDISGSMSAPEKLELLKTGFKTMVDEMRDTDRMAIVTYAGSAGVLLESTFGDEKQRIKDAIDQLGAGGSTAGAEGIITAYEIAEKNFIIGGNNRVILGSDGDFNVGPSSTEELVELIENKRESGVYLTVLGVGTGNLNESAMEQIANKGNGNYEYIDNIDQLEKVFVNEKGKFFAVAKDSKIQITFDANHVDSYRLIGYENRVLNEEDFEDDSVDAGEIGSGQTITALYELILKENTSQESLAVFDFRYKKPNMGTSMNIALEIPRSSTGIDTASENMRFAMGVAGFGLLMKDSEFKGSVSKEMILGLITNSISFDQYGYKQEFKDLVGNIP